MSQQQPKPSGFALDVWGEHDADIAVLKAELDATEDPRQAALLHYELGRWALADGREAEGARHLLRSYTLRPRFRPTLRLARILYRNRSDFPLVAKLLEAEARTTRDPLARAALIRRQGHLVWLRTGKLADALELLEEAHRLDPTDLATLKLLEQLFLLGNDRPARRQILERQVQVVGDLPLRTAIQIDLALLAEDGELRTSALEALQAAATDHPDDLSLLLTLEHLYERRGHLNELVDVLCKQAALEIERPAKAQLLARAARLCCGGVDDPERGLELFQRAVEAHHDFGAAADCFELMLDRGDLEGAIEVGALLYDLEESPDFLAFVAYQLGDLCRLGNDLDAAVHWYRRCLTHAPTYQPALEPLADLLEKAGAIDQLVSIHAADIEAATSPFARAHGHFRVAALLERHGEDERAIAAHQQALDEDPTFAPSLTALHRLLRRHERFAELVDLYQDELGRAPADERAAHLLEAKALIHQHNLDQPDESLDCWQRLLQLRPDDLEAIRSAARLCAELGRWHDLLQLNQRELSLVGDPQRQAELLQRSGEIWEHQLQETDAAIECYQSALSIAPAFLPAMRALGRLFREKGYWADLIRMHEAEIEISVDQEQILGLLHNISELCEEHLLDEVRAIETYRAILQRRPGYPPAVAALARLLERHAQWPDLAQLIESTLDVVSDDAQKALRLCQTGMLREDRLGDQQGAIADFQRALRLDPKLLPAQTALERLYESSGDRERLAQLYTDALRQAPDAHQRALLAQRLGDLLNGPADKPREAAIAYSRSIDEQPSVWSLHALVQTYERLGMLHELLRTLERLIPLLSNEQTIAELELKIGRIRQEAGLDDPRRSLAHAEQLPSGKHFARRARERYLRGIGAETELADLLLGQIEQSKDPLDLACLWTERAEVLLSRGDEVGAEQAFRVALAQSRSHLPAIWGLGTMLERQERWAERVELAELEASVTESNHGVAAALTYAATLWQDRLAEIEKALPLYEQALKVLPDHDEAYQRLHAIHTLRRDWTSLSSLLRNQISISRDNHEVANLFCELGRLYLERLDQRNKALGCLRRVLDLEEHNTYALTTLGDLHFDARQWASAEQMYARLRVLLEQDPLELARVDRRLGECHLALGQPDRALPALERAARAGRRPDPQLLRKIALAAEHAADYAAQVDALERLATCTDDPSERAAARRQIAIQAEDQLGDDDRAIRALQAIIVLDPLDLEAIEHLATIHGRTGNRAALRQHLQAAVAHHRSALGRDPFELRIYRQLARIFRWQRDLDRLYCACTVLNHMNAIDDVEARFWRDHRRRCRTMPAGTLADHYDQLVLPREARGPIRPLLRDLAPVVDKLLASDPARYGLRRNQRLSEGHPMHQLCGEMAAMLGSIDFDIWVTEADQDLIVAEIFTRPALVLGSRIANNPLNAVERFRVGRAMAALREHALLFRDRSLVELRVFFAALGFAATPPCPLPAEAEELQQAEARARTVSKRLSRRDRRLLGTTLPRHRSAFSLGDLGRFAQALAAAATRTGLLLAGDPLAAIEETTRTADDPKQHELGDLLQFVVSEEYFSLRQTLRLAPDPR